MIADRINIQGSSASGAHQRPVAREGSCSLLSQFVKQLRYGPLVSFD